MWKQCLSGLVLLAIGNVFAGDEEGFRTWVAAFKQEALSQQLSPQAVDATLNQVAYLPSVIELDRKQPEFVTSFSTYVNRRISPNVVARGKRMMQDYGGVLYVVEELYQVPQQVLVAFWGLETNYGGYLGNFALPSALATLAYEGRRAEFFKRELLNLTRVVEREQLYDQPVSGSWAGATGHMQFMPSTLLKYGVDADQDGKIDIWSSYPDIFSSAANYLSQAGWQPGAPISVMVALPPLFDYSLAQLTLKKSVADWVKLGVAGVPDSALLLSSAAIVLPQGYDGPAYMVFPNFDVIMQWNRSINYALSVSLLSQQLAQAEYDLFMPPEPPALSHQQMWVLQEALNAQGFDCGPPDGFPGAKTQAAIRRYQASKALPQDGYAGAALYARLTSSAQ
ncbi:lytic murein transglycosylase [Methylophilus aquaticus]|uniref:Lytic murein transglycosylase n=1 Tax=Methylophilus aquaticus TaxID=1971610 RepID=A0ABT9JVW7_9PROT|nr:lytic murein transglycosylase [Methylophilus aquaticus]MDP8568738.1 lytic murein transglycosylase [Methylophilus aquaticus]